VDRVKAILQLQQSEESRKAEGDRWDERITNVLWGMVKEGDSGKRRARHRDGVADGIADKGVHLESKFVVTPDSVETEEVLHLLEKMSSKGAKVNTKAEAAKAAPYAEEVVDDIPAQPNQRWKFVFKDTADESTFAVRDSDGVFKRVVSGGENKSKKTWGRRKL